MSLLSRRLLDLVSKTISDKTVTGLELLSSINRVVNETETSGLTTTVLGLQTKNGDGVLLSAVDRSKLLTELILGDVGTVGVQDVNNELTTSKKRVSDKLSSTDGH